MSATIGLKATGLSTSPNPLELDGTGALIDASNVIIKRDNIIESRRGFKLFGDSFGTITDRAKQLFTYKERILRHFATTLQFQDGTNNDGSTKFSTFSGNYSEPEENIKIKSVEANGNFYFTSSTGIDKISSVNGDGLSTDSGFIVQAGGVKALDITGRLDVSLGSTTGFMPADSAVAYRVVWGYKDANQNLILGSPSQRAEVYNSLLNLLLLDFNNVLKNLDFINQYGSLINNGDYVTSLGLGNNASAVDLYNNLTTLAIKLDKNITFADNDGSISANPPFEIDSVNISGTICTITFINTLPGATVSQYFNSGDVINLNGTFSPAALLGQQTITTVDDSTNSISFNTTATGFQTISTIADTGVALIQTVNTVADVAGSLNNTYFLISSVNSITKTQQDFYVWYNVSGGGTDPAIGGKIGIEVDIVTNSSANSVASTTATKLLSFTNDFSNASASTNVITVSNLKIGNVPVAVDGGVPTTFTFGTITLGVNSNLNNKYFFLNSTQSGAQYYVWYNVNGIGTDPAPSGLNGIVVSINGSASNIDVASASASAIQSTNSGNTFTATNTNNIITVSNNQSGSFIPASDFNTTFTFSNSGLVTIGTDSVVNSGTFRNIPLPIIPDIPTIHSQLVGLQNYLLSIITALQSLITEFEVANTTSGDQLTIDTGACSITTGTATITFSSGDPRDFLIAGNYIDLSGFTPATGSINGLQQIVSVTSTTLTFTTSATGSITVAAGALINKVIIYAETLANQFTDNLNVTTTANVILTITIPSDITSNYFYQIYRSSITQASDQQVLTTDVFPNDELQQVYEGIPTAAQLTAGSITIEDITPDEFRGANLYTNPSSGEGILQSNDRPPFAKDINKFKNTIFYANTRTRQSLSFNFLGISDLLAAANNGKIPQILLASSISNNVYNFILGEKQEISIICNAASTLNATGNGSYFTINNANNNTSYYVWYQIGTSVDPLVSGKTGIEVVLLASDSNSTVASKTSNVLNTFINDFSAGTSTNTLLVENIDFGYTDAPTAGTSGFTPNIITTGVGEKAAQETTVITTVADVAGSLAGTYFTINSGLDLNRYYVWYKVSGAGADPAIVNKTGILVNLITNDSASVVATKTAAILSALTTNFAASSLSNALTVINIKYGYTTDATAGTSGFGINITNQGALEVLLDNDISPSISVDKTARSFIRVVNLNKQEAVNAFYLSGAQDVPGKMFFEDRSLTTNPFYLLINDSPVGGGMGKDFNPDIDAEHVISNISTGSTSTMVVTTSDPHGLLNLDNILIVGTNSTPSIDGYYQITYLSPTTFRIPVAVISSGNTGYMMSTADAIISDNEVKPNRIYYSKLQQPEAVPIVNFLDVGVSDKNILRIFPLRDSLFVFKEDGLFRISGETAPFVVALFDSSYILIAGESIGLSNNLIYGWTTQGISSVSESGTKPSVSRPIDDQILTLSSSDYTSFANYTWGIGYDSDNSYIVFTGQNTTDTIANIGYRYSNLTNSWTTFDKTNTCGVVNPLDDKLYLGAGDVNFIEQERKSFNRYDYADREIEKTIIAGSFAGTKINFTDVSEIEVGDCFVQDQQMTIYGYNTLLEKLDIDTGLADSNYFSLLKIIAGADLRAALVALTHKLDSDAGTAYKNYFNDIDLKSATGAVINIGKDTVVITEASHGLADGRIILIANSTITSINGLYTITLIDSNNFSIQASTINTGTCDYSTVVSDVDDIVACYNKTISNLNIDTGPAFNNYQMIVNDTVQESIVIAVNKQLKQITLSLALDYTLGVVTIFKAITSTFTYAPQTMGDSLGLKHIYESTMMYANKAFTSATMSFSTDLVPQFFPVTFNGDGNGAFGNTPFGNGFFGGASNGAPFRTYIPRFCQRCRYLLIQHTHSTAREKYSILGCTITGNVGQSSRAYR